jgi:hypothetical protein
MITTKILTNCLKFFIRFSPSLGYVQQFPFFRRTTCISSGANELAASAPQIFSPSAGCFCSAIPLINLNIAHFGFKNVVIRFKTGHNFRCNCVISAG